MKMIAIIVLVILFAAVMFFFKKGNTTSIKNNQATTTGVVIEVFNRGKLPFCTFKYSVDNITYTKKQELQKQASKHVLNKTFQVLYEKGNPNNAILKFK
ncbi:hypothetical protein [Wenyingzhuangia sp. IMCC45574]